MKFDWKKYLNVFLDSFRSKNFMDQLIEDMKSKVGTAEAELETLDHLSDVFKEIVNISNIEKIEVILSTNKSKDHFNDMKIQIFSGQVDFTKEYPFSFLEDNIWFYQVTTKVGEYYVIATVDYWDQPYSDVIWNKKMYAPIDIPPENTIYDKKRVDVKLKKELKIEAGS